MSIENSQKQIELACSEIKHLLLSKNKKYGDAALNPTRIMSKASTVEQLLVRIDDKLNRISKGAGLLATDEDVVKDLCGYFILLKIALQNQKTNTLPENLSELASVQQVKNYAPKPQNVPFTPEGVHGPSGTVGPTGIQVEFPEKLREDRLPYFVDN